MCGGVDLGRVRRNAVSLPDGGDDRQEGVGTDRLGVGAVYAYDGLRSVRGA